MPLLSGEENANAPAELGLGGNGLAPAPGRSGLSWAELGRAGQGWAGLG